VPWLLDIDRGWDLVAFGSLKIMRIESHKSLSINSKGRDRRILTIEAIRHRRVMDEAGVAFSK